MKLEKSMIRKNIPLVLALMFAVLSFSLLYRYVDQIIRPQPVLVAAREIKAGEKFSQENIRVEDIPGKGVMPRAVVDPGELQGKQAAVSISAGQQICSNMLLEAGGQQLLREGQRAVAVKATLTNALGGRLKRGDRVDIFARGQDKITGQVYCRPLLSDITVLGVLDEQGREFAARQKDVLDKGGRLMPGAILLAVNQNQVTDLLRYETMGELVLAGSSSPE